MSEINVSRILHAGYVFESSNAKIIFDPIFENPFSINCHAFPGVEFDYDLVKAEKLSAIFISHYHEDHCSLESLNLLDKSTPVFIFCREESIVEMIRQLGFLQVSTLEWGVPIVIQDLKVTPIRALDVDVDCIFEITNGSIRILNVVDSWIDNETLDELSLQKWDLVLWPFQTMRELEVISLSPELYMPPEIPKEQISSLQKLNPKVLVPSSCQFLMEEGSWYNSYFFPISYKFFEEQVGIFLNQSVVLRLEPGHSTVFDKASGSLTWTPASSLSWIRVLDKNLNDYSFKPQTPIPTTAKISAHFPIDQQDQKKFIVNYFNNTIFQRILELDPDNASFFYKNRVWKVRLWLNEIESLDFCYKLKNLELEFASEEAPDWTTEIPAQKFINALSKGESLTSIYLRVTPAKKFLHLEDALQDPLLRCLYEGKVASYQKAQLKKIRGLDDGGTSIKSFQS